jgi:hypothetical protein
VYYNTIEGDLGVECVTSTEFAVIADHAGSDGIAAFKLDNAGTDARLREVGLFDPLMGLGEHNRLVELDQR